jgi:acyl-CoA synthetase (NDP forming)
MLSSGYYDAAIVFLGFAGLNSQSMGDRIKSLTVIANKFKDIPILSVSLCNDDSLAKFKENGLAIIDDPTRAVQALKVLNDYRDLAKLSRDIPAPYEHAAEQLPETYQSGPTLTEYSSKRLLEAFGLPVTREKLAQTADEAVDFAKEIGFPLAMKGMSPEIPHKTDYGLVKLWIQNEDEVREHFQEMKQKIGNVEGATFEGVLVQEMLPGGGVEMVVGANWDPVFSQMVVIGTGGVFIELLQDISMRKAPVSVQEAERMIYELRAVKLLKGFRGQKAADLKALSQLISDFSRLIAGVGDKCREVDMNPVIVFEDGAGCKIADALITLKK